jgi:multidrug efflux pump
MYMAFYSETMEPSQITDYLLRVVQPQLQAVPGVAKAGLIGNKDLRHAHLARPARMAALEVTPNQVLQVLQANNYLAGVGQTKGAYVIIDLRADTDISSEADFRQLVVRAGNGTLVRLEDIATAELGSEDYDSLNLYKGTSRPSSSASSRRPAPTR